MKPNERFSLFFVQEIEDNCQMLAERVEEYAMTRESYAQSTLFQDMLTMPMLRICEIAKLYRSDLEALYPHYDWRSVGAMRDKMAHPYGGFDYEFVWDAVESDIDDLKKICQLILSE